MQSDVRNIIGPSLQAAYKRSSPNHDYMDAGIVNLVAQFYRHSNQGFWQRPLNVSLQASQDINEEILANSAKPTRKSI
jgi:hypothetical protein